MTPAQHEEAEQSNSPWAAQQAPTNIVQADEASFIDDMYTQAVGYLDEAGINPMADAEEAVGRFDDTAGAMTRANGGSR